MNMLRILSAISLIVLSVGACYAESRVNILFRDGTSEVEQDRALVNSGAAKIKRLAAHGIVTANASNDASVKSLSQQANVLAVGPDLIAVIINTDAGARGGKGGPPTPPPPAQVVPTGISRIGANLGVGGNTPITVAIVDTGIDLTHPDLAGAIVGSVNSINSRKSPSDDNGHGTHVSGTVAARDNSIGVVGVAPKASLLAVKVLNSAGSGYISDISDGINWAVAHDANVINMSLGYDTFDGLPPFPDPLGDAVRAAYNAGVIVVCAAGNSGPDSGTVNFPAKYAESIAVAAWTDLDGTSDDIDLDTDNGTDGPDESLASFSSRGPQVDIAAPGVYILSLWRGGGTKTISGTSMASPHVAGAVARLMQGGATGQDAIRAALAAKAEKLTGYLPAEVGVGLVRVAP